MIKKPRIVLSSHFPIFWSSFSSVIPSLNYKVLDYTVEKHSLEVPLLAAKPMSFRLKPKAGHIQEISYSSHENKFPSTAVENRYSRRIKKRKCKRTPMPFPRGENLPQEYPKLCLSLLVPSLTFQSQSPNKPFFILPFKGKFYEKRRETQLVGG